MHGLAGYDNLEDGPGNDQLFGGTGDNRLTGGLGNDFKGRFGHDTIKEFSVTDWDLMYFALVDFPTSAAAIAAARQQGTDTVIQTADGRSVRLKNFNVNNLTSDAVRVE